MWQVKARVGTTLKHFLWTPGQDALQPSDTPDAAAPGLPKGALGQANGLLMTKDGDGPSYDLKVQRGDAHLIVENLHITANLFAHLPNLGAVAVVTGDPGTSTSRRIILLPLGALMEALDAGQTRLDSQHLDHTRLLGATNGIDLDQATLSIVPVADSPEFVCMWNVSQGRATTGHFKLVWLNNHQPGIKLAHLNMTVSTTHTFEGLWLSRFEASRRTDGCLQVTFSGVARRRQDFCPSIRRLTAQSPEASLWESMSEQPFEACLMDKVKLRDNSGVKAFALDPEGGGALLTYEDIFRKRHLVYVGLKEPLTITPMKGPNKANALWIEAAQDNAKLAAAPTPPPQSTEGAAAPAGALLHAPTQRQPFKEGQPITIPHGGIDVELGKHPRDSDLWAQVYVMGDGRGANLQWWISQQEGDADKVSYTLHACAAREVTVRLVVFEGQEDD